MSTPKCGLCGKTNNLTKTECCDSWICDDEDSEEILSFTHKSCHLNHRRTLCYHHYIDEHKGADWKHCEECKTSFETEMYVYYGTNNYNFTKLENPPKYEPTRCKNCNKIIKLSDGGYIISADGIQCCSDTQSKNKVAQNTKTKASKNIQEAKKRSKSENGLVKGKDPNAMVIEDEDAGAPQAKKRGKSVKSKPIIKPTGNKKKKKAPRKTWVYVGEDANKKTGAPKMERGRKKSVTGRSASSSRANSRTSNTAQAGKSNAASKSKSKQPAKGRKSDNSGEKYGKRKATQADGESGLSQSISQTKAKKVKKNNTDNKGKEKIELNLADSLRSGRSSTSTQRIGNARDTLDLARSHSAAKGKKKVQGIKKKT